MSDFGEKRILIVDDYADHLLILQKHLSMYKSDTARNGKLALSMAEQNIPDLILLDIMMPDMNGFTVAERLKENNKTAGIPVIFITAQSNLSSLYEGVELRKHEIVTKPYNPDVLIEIVKSKLEGSEVSINN